MGTPGEEASRLVFEAPGASRVTEAGTFQHLPWAVVRGRMLPKTRTAVVVADVFRRGDGSFGAALIRLSPGAPAKVLAGRVFHATRPLVTSNGRVFVERGVEGVPPADEEVRTGRLRIDALTIDEINPSTGEARTVHAFEGYTTHLVGALGDELLLYRVRHQHADLVAVHTDSGAVRPLRPEVLPFARDFSLSEAERVLRWSTLDPSSREWIAVELDLDKGTETVLARALKPSIVPSAWPEGGWAFNPGGDQGLTLMQRGEPKRIAPLGPGADVVRAVSADREWVALDHTRPATRPAPFVISRDGAQVLTVSVPEGMRSEILGFVEARQ